MPTPFHPSRRHPLLPHVSLVYLTANGCAIFDGGYSRCIVALSERLTRQVYCLVNKPVAHNGAA